MSRAIWIAHTGHIGMAVPEELAGMVSAASEFRFDLKRMPDEKFSKLLNVARHGYSTEESGLVTSVLSLIKMAHQVDMAPALPRISYVGKKTLTIYTRGEGRAQEIAHELVGYGLMIDRDYKPALSIYSSRVVIDGLRVHTLGKTRREKKAAHLQTHFPGVMPMVKKWCAETVEERSELIDFLVPRPIVTIRLVRKHEGERS